MRSYYVSAEEPISKTPAKKMIAGRFKRTNNLAAVNLVIACIAFEFLGLCVNISRIEVRSFFS